MNSFLVALIVIAAILSVGGWLVTSADNRADVAKEIESAMVAESLVRVRAALAMRGHLLRRAQRKAAEVWLAEMEIKEAASADAADAAAAEGGKEASDAGRA